jgi:hypothetical protein
MNTSSAKRLPITAAEYLEESIGLTLPVSAFYRTAPFPDDVARPWYLRFREDG